jgi:uncharacterized protein
MSDSLSKPCTAFGGHRLLLSGPLVEVALAVKTATEHEPLNTFLVFDDVSGRVIDLDLRGSKADIIERLARPPKKFIGRHAPRPNEPPSPSEEPPPEPRGRGRPKLGVVAREVTLLPRQWEWLSAQPGGASAVLRRLVDEARRDDGSLRRRRAAQEAAYQFMLAIAGDFTGYEEATRALFADDRPKLEQLLLEWPADIRAHVTRLAFDKTTASE